MQIIFTCRIVNPLQLLGSVQNLLSSSVSSSSGVVSEMRSIDWKKYTNWNFIIISIIQIKANWYLIIIKRFYDIFFYTLI